MVVAALTALADEGKIDISVAADAAKKFKIDDPTAAKPDSDYSPESGME